MFDLGLMNKRGKYLPSSGLILKVWTDGIDTRGVVPQCFVQEYTDEFEITGTTYYVSNSGSDSNDGLTESTPWQTLTKVASASLSAGDGILFNCGDTFIGDTNLPRVDGTAVDRVIYGKYGTGDNPIIEGRMRIRVDYSCGGSYNVLQDLDLSGASSRALDISGYDNLVFKRLEVHNAGGLGMDIRDVSGTNACENLIIEDCEIHHNNSYGIWGDAGDGTIVRRTLIHNNGLTVAANNCSLTPSTLGAEVTIEDCESYSAAGYGFGTAVDDAVSVITYRRCNVYGNGEGGVIGHGTLGEVVFENMVIRDNLNTGVATSGSTDVKVLNCTITGNAVNGLNLNSTGAHTVLNNIIWANAIDSGVNFNFQNDGTLISDYNCVDTVNPNVAFYYDGSSKTFSEWQALGYGANSTTDNPLLTDNYEITGGSPCATSGSVPFVDGDGTRYDLKGTQVWDDDFNAAVYNTRGAWFMGAYAPNSGGRVYNSPTLISGSGLTGTYTLPICPTLLAADDGTIYTSYVPNQIDLSTFVDSDWMRSGTEYWAAYSEDQDANAIVKIDKYIGN